MKNRNEDNVEITNIQSFLNVFVVNILQPVEKRWIRFDFINLKY